MNYISKNEKIVEYMIYIDVFLLIFCMSFYVYIKRYIPIIPYVKDLLLFLVFPLLTFKLVVSSFKIKKLNYLDNVIVCLFVYLLFQFVRTGVELSYAISYSGFRLNFMYIFLYFLYKSISTPNLLYRIDKIFFKILVIGLLITFMEAFFIKTGLISVHTLGKFMVVNRYANQEYFRVYGITGSVQLSGLYNGLFFAILLYGLNLKRDKIDLRQFHFLEKIKSLHSKNLLFLSFLAVIVSLSRTAWTCIGLILVLFIFSKKKFNVITLYHVFISMAVGITLTMIYFGSEVYQTYFTFAVVYVERILRDLAPLLDAFWFGTGYHVSQTAVGVDQTVLMKNIQINTDYFFLDIFSNLGFVGLVLYGILFALIPLYMVVSNKYGYSFKVIAAPIILIGIAFGHYSPLQNPALNIFLWYLFAQLSRMLDTPSFNIQQPSHRKGFVAP
jgi:hypothetical protein